RAGVVVWRVAGLVSFAVGEPVNAGIIVVMVLLSVAINTFQTYRSQQAADQLRAQCARTATALRDGQRSVVPRRELVPGDVIRLVAGDLVPADAWLITARD